MHDDPHDMPEKPVQLGMDPNNEDRTPISDEEKDALWASATTVEEEKKAYDALEDDRASNTTLSREEYAQLWS